MYLIAPSRLSGYPCSITQGDAHLVAALCSPVWQNRNLSSFNPCVNAYFVAIVVL
jgi:hypothetical protein